MKVSNNFRLRLTTFGERYTLGNMFDGSLGFIDTVNINKILQEDYSISLVILYEAIKQGRKIQDSLAKVINKNIEYASKVNVYLITDWIRHTLTLGKPIHDVFMQCSSLIGKIFPDIKPCIGFDVHSSHHEHTVYEHMLYVVDGCETNKFEVKLAALFHDVGKPNVFTMVGDRGSTSGHPRESAEIAKTAFDFYIRLSKEEIDYITELILIHDKFIAPTDRSIRKVLNQYGLAFMDDYCVLKKSDMLDHINIEGIWKNYDIDNFREKLHELDAKNKEFSIKDLDITGEDILFEFGIEPGKIVGVILNELLNDALSGRVKNNWDDLINRACSIYDRENSIRRD